MILTEEQFNQRYIKAFIDFRLKIESDKLIYGDAFIQLTSRKIEILDPTKVSLTYDKKRKRVVAKATSKGKRKVLYEKVI